MCEYIFQALADDPHVAANTHKISVTFPARHYVKVNMARQARARTAVDIETHVKTLRVDAITQGTLNIAAQEHHLQQFRFGQMIHIGDMVARGDQHMTAGIGKTVQQNHARAGTPKNEIFVILLRIGPIVAQKTFGGTVGRFGSIERFEIFHTPGCPKIVVFHNIMPMLDQYALICRGRAD